MPPVKSRTSTRKPSSPRKRKAAKRSHWWKVLLAGVLLVLLSPFYYAYILKFASSAWFWLKHPTDDPNYRTYESYQIKIPKKYSIHGIDVSYYQGKIDWHLVRSMEDDGVKISFAFIKATEGVAKVDPYFQRNWREAPKTGIKVGAYHFFRANKPGLWQAKFFLQTITVEKGDLPPVVDVEGLDGVSASEMRKQLTDFLNHVEKKTKVRPIIYSGLKFYQDYLLAHYEKYPFWLAHYYQPELKVASYAYRFWQHSDKARVNGINHAVDFNVFNGDSLKFEQMLIP